MKNKLLKIYQYIDRKIIMHLPSWVSLNYERIKTDIISFFLYKKLKNFSLDPKMLNKTKKNIVCFSEHPYTNKILKNGINVANDKYNLLTFWKVFSIYTNISKWDRNSSFNMEWWWNYRCYEKLWMYYTKNNQKTFNKDLLGACDFSLPTQVFSNQNKNLIYLNHRFPYLWFFNVFKISDWKKKIKNLKQENNILIAADNFDYEYHKYLLWENKKIFFIPPLTDNIKDKYEGSKDSFLIVPGKNKYFKQREIIMDSCIEMLWQEGIEKVFSITKKYKNKKYEFKEISQYKALIVVPYTIYIGSIMDFLEMWMPMFFPSVKLLASWHKEYNLLVEYDFISFYNYAFKKDIFNNKFLNKIEKIIWKRDIPSPYSNEVEDLKYRIWRADRYYNWPIITYDSFEDLAGKLKTVDMKNYSKTLLEFNRKMKEDSKQKRVSLLNNI